MHSKCHKCPPLLLIFAFLPSKNFYCSWMKADTYSIVYIYNIHQNKLLCMSKPLELPTRMALQHIDSFLRKSENKFCSFQFAWILSTKKFTTSPNMFLLNGVYLDMSSGAWSFHPDIMHPFSWNPATSWHYFASLWYLYATIHCIYVSICMMS